MADEKDEKVVYPLPRMENDILLWYNDEDLKLFADELLSKQPVNAATAKEGDALDPEGVHWTDLQRGIDRDSSSNKGLLTRKDSRGVVDAVVEFMESSEAASPPINSMSVVTGTPGIGKSRMLMALLKHLLELGRNVMYFDLKSRSASFFFTCTKKIVNEAGEDEVVHVVESAWRSTMATYIANSTLFHDPSIHVLVDPSDRDSNFAYPTKAHLVLAASTNSARHYAGFTKHIGTQIFYLGAWSEKEMVDVSERLRDSGSTVSAEMIKERRVFVGGTLRYVFSELMFKRRKAEISVKATTLTEATLTSALVAAKLVDDEEDSGLRDDGRLPGAFFTYENKPDENGVVDYTQRNIVFLTSYCKTAAARLARSTIMNSKTLKFAGMDLEDVVLNDLLGASGLRFSGVFNVFALGKDAQKLQRGFRFPVIGPDDVVVGLSVDDCFSKMATFFAAAAEDPDAPPKLLVPSRPPEPQVNLPVADFVTSNGDLIQVTKQKEHSCAFSGVMRILLAAGLLQRKDDNTLEEVEFEDPAQKPSLRYVKVVQYDSGTSKNSDWGNKPRPKISSTAHQSTFGYAKASHNGQKVLVSRVWYDNVTFYIGRLPK